MKLFDASALLAFLQGEDGSQVVERELDADARCSAVNWSEVAQKVRAHRGDWTLTRALLLSYGLRVEPVLSVDGERAAAAWIRGSGLSLADRICLATAVRLNATVITADDAWGNSPTIVQIR